MILVGDIDRDLQFSSSGTFADDTKLSKSVKNKEDICKLQSGLNIIYNWATINNMKLNREKLQHLRYGKSSFPGACTTTNGDTVTPVNGAVDLGAIMEGSGKFGAQIRSAAQKG